MFKDAVSFDQNLSTWDITSVTTSVKSKGFNEMFSGVTLSTSNYDALLIGWGSQLVNTGMNFSGGNSQYCSPLAIAARSALNTTYSWNITDGGLFGGICPPVSPVTLPDIIDLSDSGFSSLDDVTLVVHPDINVQCSEIGNTINVYSDYPVADTLVGTQVCSSVGTETIPTTMVNGIQKIKYTNKKGLIESPYSASLRVVIDTDAPTIPTIDKIQSGDDSISGLGEVGTYISLADKTCSNSPVIVASNGAWECLDVDNRPKSGERVIATSKDIAGNESIGEYRLSKKASSKKSKKEIESIFNRQSINVIAENSTGDTQIPQASESNPFGGEQCSAELIIHDFMKKGNRNGNYASYNKGTVTEIDILQGHMNRLLLDEYGNQASGPIDGIFGPLTHTGVERLQTRLNQLLPDMTPLVIDGIVGPFTREAINNSC